MSRQVSEEETNEGDHKGAGHHGDGASLAGAVGLLGEAGGAGGTGGGAGARIAVRAASSAVLRGRGSGEEELGLASLAVGGGGASGAVGLAGGVADHGSASLAGGGSSNCKAGLASQTPFSVAAGEALGGLLGGGAAALLVRRSALELVASSADRAAVGGVAVLAVALELGGGASASRRSDGSTKLITTVAGSADVLSCSDAGGTVSTSATSISRGRASLRAGGTTQTKVSGACSAVSFSSGFAKSSSRIATSTSASIGSVIGSSDTSPSSDFSFKGIAGSTGLAFELVKASGAVA